jgi:hypothetical protein
VTPHYLGNGVNNLSVDIKRLIVWQSEVDVLGS